jgi:serine/threonine protein kinase
MSSDIEHWHINAIVHKDRVEETHYISDPARNIRRQPETTTWLIDRLLGRGGFGEVRLERNKQNGKERAVKRIAIMGAKLTNIECKKELKALLEFSKPKVSQPTCSTVKPCLTPRSHSLEKPQYSSTFSVGSKTDPNYSLPWSTFPLEISREISWHTRGRYLKSRLEASPNKYCLDWRSCMGNCSHIEI